MTLLTKAQWKVATDTEVASPKRNGNSIFMPAISVPIGCKTTGS